MPCFYYSPNAKASTKPKNVPFTEAELGSHVLRMCPIQWQDHYNMNKKGITSMDLRLLLTSLEVIERLCTYKKAKPESSEKVSHKGRKGKKRSGTKSMVGAGSCGSSPASFFFLLKILTGTLSHHLPANILGFFGGKKT